MGNRGPKAKPTAIRALQGNPGKRPLNKFEPKPPRVAKAEPPEWLSDQAKLYWFRLLPMLSRCGLLTEADLPAFERYCDALADFRMYQDFLSRGNRGLGFPVYDQNHKNEKGQLIPKYLKLHPHSLRKLNISEHLLRFEQQFGMTPSARSRIMLMDPDLPPPPSNFGADSEIPEEETYDPFKPPA